MTNIKNVYHKPAKEIKHKYIGEVNYTLGDNGIMNETLITRNNMHYRVRKTTVCF